jgi:hypothetical protein
MDLTTIYIQTISLTVFLLFPNDARHPSFHSCRYVSGPKLWHLYTENSPFSKKLDFLQQEWTKEGKGGFQKIYSIVAASRSCYKSGIIFVNNPRMCLCKNPPDLVVGLFCLA